MTRLLICTALGVEAHALRRGLPADPAEVTLLRTGMGPVRAERTAARLPAFGALAVAGFGGALDRGLRPGDVLVASEVRFGDRLTPCPSARLLAGELTRAGISARVGPLLTSDHVVTGAERLRLSGTGARAVDMESGPLAAAAAGRPFAAVRVIVDTPDRTLLSRATVSGGLAARRTLGRIGPILMRWAAAAGPRRVLRGLGPVTVDENPVAEETIRFTLPQRGRS
jgi:4-hydroxy-3-methylbut-2-enyl diphosphate reductase